MEETQVAGIYHKDCIDGTMAAAALLRKFPHARLFPLSHKYSREELEPVLALARQGAACYTLDCIIGGKELLEAGAHLTMLDHHISAQEEGRALAQTYPACAYVFDIEKSGASLAWSYLFPDEPVPELVSLVQDADLWAFRHGDDTIHANNYLEMFRNDPAEMLRLAQGDITEIKIKGAVITRYADSQIQDLIRMPRMTLRIGEHDVPAYNISMHESECGNILSAKLEKAVALFTLKGSDAKISFRSKDDHTPSALDLALLLGGGGHRNASGAHVPLAQFLSILHMK